MIVIDASVALGWCFEDEAAPANDAVLARVVAEGAAAPAIWPIEMANALRTAERRSRIDPATAVRARQLLLALPIAVEPVSLADALADVSETSRRHDISAYDASYLVLAARLGLPLATADGRLRAACVQAGIELVQS